MRVLIRADASVEIGAGHVMRCLSLCNGFDRGSSTCTFISRSMPEPLANLLAAAGHELIILSTAEDGRKAHSQQDYSTWIPTSQEKDAVDCLAALNGRMFDWLIIDHYALDERFERQMQVCTQKILVVDDLANRRHFCDVIVDQNLGREQSDYISLTTDQCKIFTGPHYALLRTEFSELRDFSLRRRMNNSVAKTILVSLGGFDEVNATTAVVEALSKEAIFDEFSICVVASEKSNWISEVRRQVRESGSNFSLLTDVKNMAEILANTDLAIGAGGGSAWERCCLGVPTLLVVTANNQRSGSEALERAGAAFICELDGEFALNLRKMMSCDLGAMSNKAASICDGEGVARIVSEMKKLQDHDEHA